MKLTAKGKRYLANFLFAIIAIAVVVLVAAHAPKGDVYKDHDMIQAEASTWESYVTSIGGNPWSSNNLTY
jgi:hypothetical protein